MLYGSRRFDRACLNHLRNMSSVSIISVKPALLIFTVETIEGGPGWVWPVSYTHLTLPTTERV